MRKNLIRIFAFLQIFALALGLCACSKNDKVEVFDKEQCVNFIGKFDTSKDIFFDALEVAYSTSPEKKENVEQLRTLFTEIDFSMQDFVKNYEIYKQLKNNGEDVVSTYSATGFEYKNGAEELSIYFTDDKVKINLIRSQQESRFELICFGENDYVINYWQTDSKAEGYSVVMAKFTGSGGRLKFDQSVLEQFESIIEKEDFADFAENTGVGFYYTTI